MRDHWEVARRVLEENWVEEGGFTSPNRSVYPWRWLWDSCFHAILWARLDPGRALRELEAVFQAQDPVTGFVPHIHYVGTPGYDRTLWGRDAVSTITQPPMYGHAIRVMADLGIDIPDRLIEAAHAGIRFFLDTRADHGLIRAVHPWETGCDDSPRWDSWVHEPFRRQAFALIKGRLVGTLVVEGDGVAVDNPEFSVGSVALTALVVFNALELAHVTANRDLARAAGEMTAALGAAWDDSLGTWVDRGADPRPSGRAPTLEAYLPLLVDHSRWDRARAILTDPHAFRAPYGPRQVDGRHPGYRPDEYWRGAAWPQLNYLLWLAALRRDDRDWASQLADTTLAGASASGWSEYWNPETGEGHGAAPQSWTGLAAAMQDPG